MLSIPLNASVASVHAVLHMARVISQHTLLDDAESPGQFLYFLTLLPQELNDVLPSLSS